MPSSVLTRAALSRSSLAGVFCKLLPPPPEAQDDSSRRTGRKTLCRMFVALVLASLFQLAAEFGLAARAVHHLALQLAAGGVDVVAARAAHHREHVRVEQD